ncbi:MAG: DUF4097 family beta strand repeat protein [Lachnospiraceae bacterium]|nr:DUF4097 family beta strand repeat protein [Lachnospiraceae bacterium]
MNKIGNRWMKIMTFAGVITLMLAAFTGCTPRINYIYNNAENYTAGDRVITDQIENINIDYMSGNVTLTGTDTNTITITETANKEIDDKRKVHTWVDGSTLYVRFCASAKYLDFNDIEKELDIVVPEGVKLNILKSDVSSGGFTCRNIEADSISAECSSGGIDLDCTAGTINLEASSGSITLNQHGSCDTINLSASSGTLSGNIEHAGKLSLEASSGNIEMTLGTVKEFDSELSSGNSTFTFLSLPETSDIHASSGDITLYAPADPDLTVYVDTSSGDFNYELPLAKKDGNYVCGNGACKMNIEASSGDVMLYKLAD